MNSVRAVSNTPTLAELVKTILKELGQGGLQQILNKVNEKDKIATKHMVRKILEEAEFAEQRLGEIPVERKGTPYKKKGSPVWIYKDQREKTAIPTVKTGPSFEVMIMPRRQRKTAYRIIEEIEHETPEVVEFQDLQITVRNLPVMNLQAKVYFDDGGIRFDPKIAYYFDWGGTRMFDFVVNQTDRIIIWLAYRIGDIEKILPNLWSNTPLIMRLKEIYQRKNPYIDMHLQFIGEGLIDDKPRNYRLNLQSWKEINLTEREH